MNLSRTDESRINKSLRIRYADIDTKNDETFKHIIHRLSDSVNEMLKANNEEEYFNSFTRAYTMLSLLPKRYDKTMYDAVNMVHIKEVQRDNVRGLFK